MTEDVRTRIYTTEKLGPKQSLTPEGFLLCMDVPIARTGSQVYGPGETPVQAGPDGRVVIYRMPEEVFRPETIASFMGKPVVNDHPDGDVTPANWNDLAVGIVLNVKRNDDLLVADLLITNAAAIKDIADGKRQVSCGYDADYFSEDGTTGVGYQKNIVGNHVALVDEARCGDRCSIGDKQTTHDCSCKGEQGMTRWDRIVATVRDAMGSAFKPEHEKPLKDSLLKHMTADALAKDEGEGGAPIHIHAAGTGDRSKYTDAALEEKFAAHDAKFKAHDEALQAHGDKLTAHDSMFKAHDAASEKEEEEKKVQDEETKKIEGDLEEEAPQGTGDRKAKDSAPLETVFINAAAAAEIIVPGISLPVFDRAAVPTAGYKVLCALRKKTLTLAAMDVSGGRVQMLEGLAGGKTLDAKAIDAMHCGKARDMFNALAVLVRTKNNDGNRSVDANGNWEHGMDDSVRMPMTLAEVNKRNRERYKVTQ